MPKDIELCLEKTKADAVMSAEGILGNPFLFEGRHTLNWVVATEYLNFVELYGASQSSIRAHIFRICHHRCSLFLFGTQIFYLGIFINYFDNILV